MNTADSWFTDLNATYKKRRALIEELALLMNATFDPNSVGMFVWAKLNDGALSSEAFIDKILYEKDIFITPGTIFGTQGEGYIRSVLMKIKLLLL